MKIRHALFTSLIILALASTVLAGEKTGVGKADYDRLLEKGAKFLRTGKYVKSIETFEEAAGLEPERAEAFTGLGKARMKIWKYDEAKEALDRAHALDPEAVDPMTWLGRFELHELEYIRSFRWLQDALKKDPENADALAVLSLLLIHLDDLDRSEEVCEKALKADSNHALARICKGHLLLLRKKVKAAAREFARCLKKNRWSGGAHVGLSQTLSTMNRTAEALRVLESGLKRNPFLPTLYSNRAFVQFKLKRVDIAVRNYRKALSIDPEYGGGHGVYPFYQGVPGESTWPSGEAKQLLKAAIRSMEGGDAVEARARARDAEELAQKNLFVLLVLGAAEYAMENAEGVLETARKAMALNDRAPLPHVLFLQGRGLKQELKKLELSKVDFYARFKTRESPDVPDVRTVFSNFDSLTSDGRKVVLLAVAPMAHYIPKLKEEGVFHYILPLYKHLTDVDAMSPWKGEKTFDGRYYDSVRGAAGKVAVTGVETLWPATRMGPSTLAHEFAHQIHRYGLSGERKSTISRLYKRAKKEGRCLDYYAAENEQEYFAQGYEAFISDFKRPTSSETGKHTARDLERKDPALFRFIREITKGGRAVPSDGK